MSHILGAWALAVLVYLAALGMVLLLLVGLGSLLARWGR